MFIKGRARRARGLVCGAAAVLWLLAGTASAQTVARDGTVVPVIRVTRDATVSVKPDVADLDVGVVTQAKTAAAAATENARRADQVIAGLKKAVGAGGEVKTISYNVQPNARQEPFDPNRRPSAPVIESYTVTNIVRTRIVDVSTVGRVLDQALQLGANNVQNLGFTLKDDQKPRADAVRLAAAKARAAADNLAASLGLKIVRIVSAGEDGAGEPPVLYEDAPRFKMAAASAPTPVVAGSLDVRASVSLVVEVGPAAR